MQGKGHDPHRVLEVCFDPHRVLEVCFGPHTTSAYWLLN